MRLLPLAAVSAALLLAACGSTPSSTPGGTVAIASGGESGAVASETAACAAGPPARSPLVASGDSNDGVVGAIYNDTPTAVYIHNGAKTVSDDLEATCRLDAGKRAAFAGTTNVNQDVVLYISLDDYSLNRSGTRVDLSDGLAFWPQAWAQGFSFKGGGRERNCESEEKKRANLSEGESTSYNEGPLGEVTIERLDDDARAAREWVGTDSSKVDDWARMDVRIKRVGTCA